MGVVESELEALVALQFGSQFGPAAWDLLVEHLQIHRDQFGVVILKQEFDGVVEFTGIDGFGELSIHRAILVLDAHDVAEGTQHLLLATHQPGLQQVIANAVADRFIEFRRQRFEELMRWGLGNDHGGAAARLAAGLV